MRTKEKLPRTSAKIAAELRDLADAHRGLLTPAAVVQFAASHPRSALHAAFEWDDQRAAHLHRLEKARWLIRCTVLVIPGVDPPVRAYVSLTPDRVKDDGGYRPIGDVLARASWREQMLADALAELQTFREKYHLLKSLRPVFRAADRVALAAKAQAAKSTAAKARKRKPKPR